MRFLISACSQREGLPKPISLLEVNTATMTIIPMRLDHPDVPGHIGILGIMHHNGDIVAVTQGDITTIVRLDHSYKIKSVNPIGMIRHGHSICARKNTLYVASTSTDSVVRLGRRPKHFWRANMGLADTIHLNSIVFRNGELLASAFNERAGPDWLTARSGSIRNLTTGKTLIKPIYHPHSLTLDNNGRLHYCESAMSKVVCEDGSELYLGGGYVRALAFTDRHMLVGASVRRDMPKAISADSCTLFIYTYDGSLNCCELVCAFDLGNYADEIYDVLIL